MVVCDIWILLRAEQESVMADLEKILIELVFMPRSEGEIEKLAVEVRRPLVLGTTGLRNCTVSDGWSDGASCAGGVETT